MKNQVGEWEVRHALRQSEEELRDKDLVSRERIEELLLAVRQESAAASDNRGATSPERRGKDDELDQDRFPKGASLDAFFSLTGDEDGARNEVNQDGSADSSLKADVSRIADAAADLEMVPVSCTALESSRGKIARETKQVEDVDAAGGAGEMPQQRTDRNFLGNTRTSSARRSTERERASLRTKTEQAEPAKSTTARAGGSSPAPVPRPKRLRKKKPATVAAPELAALFRTPLLVRHLDPPIAGSAAAAVMAGGARRVKPGAGDAVVGNC